MTDVEVRKPVLLRSIPGIELTAIGTWRASTGVTTFTPEDLTNAVAALECPGVRNPVLKLGHDEPDSTSGVRWDGEPAVGWVGNMHMDGAKLIGDFMGMPAWLADQQDDGLSVIASAYPDRSVEISRPFLCQIGHVHPSVITAVSFLGVYAPGVGVLKSMQDVYAIYTQPTSADLLSSMDLAVSGSKLSTTVRLAAAEPRQPTAREVAAGVDFAAAQEDWEQALADLLEQWPDISEAQRAELTAQVEEAVDSNPDALGALVVSTAAAAAALLPAMSAVAAGAITATLAEAAHQGVRVPKPSIDDEELTTLADAVAAAMGASTASMAGRTAAQALGTGTGKDIATRTSETLAGLTDRFLRDQLGGALSAAQAAGRFKVLEVAPIAEYYASEANDVATCEKCAEIDGTKFESLDAARQAYGSGKYVDCLGRERCRGQVFATWGTAAKANPGTPVLATTIRTGGPMPTAPGGTVRASVSVEDISRQYYESAGYSMWITAMHVDPLELIAADDATGKFFRVPVQLSGDKFEFGEPSEVAINYVEVPVAAKALPHRWGNRKASLAAAGVTEVEKSESAVAKPHTYSGTAANPAGAPDGGAAIRKLASATQTPDADSAGSTTTPEEAEPMPDIDKVKIREALGLAADAPDSAVTAKLAESFSLSAPAPAATPAPSGTDPASLLANIPAGSDAIVLDLDNYKALLGAADKGVKAYEEMQRSQRDTVLMAAAKEGRFPVAKLTHYQQMWDKDPENTKAFIDMMPKNAVPTMNVGFLGAEVDKNEADLAYESMYGTGA